MSATEEPTITLKYWNGRGLMEAPRLMMAIAGKKYNDVRVSGTADAGNTLDTNLGRVPICECPEGSIGQGNAINFYIASHCGMMGSTPFEAAQIMSFVEHIGELRKAFMGLVPWGTEPTPEALATFFDSNDVSYFSINTHIEHIYSHDGLISSFAILINVCFLIPPHSPPFFKNFFDIYKTHLYMYRQLISRAQLTVHK